MCSGNPDKLPLYCTVNIRTLLAWMVQITVNRSPIHLSRATGRVSLISLTSQGSELDYKQDC